MPRRNSIKGEMRDEVVSQFMLLAEAEGDKATYHRPRIRKDAGIVYCIEIGKDHYVGSTFDPQERSRSHMGMMASGGNLIADIQAAYDRERRAKMYVVMQVVGDKEVLREAETLCIMLMRPSLNRALPKPISNIVWQPSVPRPLLQPGQTPCPWCGYPIDVSIRKGEALTEEDMERNEDAIRRHEDRCKKAQETAQRIRNNKKQ